MRYFFLLIIITLSSSFHVQAKLIIAPQIEQALRNHCLGKKGKDQLHRLIQDLNPKRCHVFFKHLGQHFFFPPQEFKTSLSHLHLHLPWLTIIEEEDDILNDDIYMWFVITRDGVPQVKVTKIYRGLDEGSVLAFDSDDRIISNLPFFQHMVIDFGLVESDGDDISQMQTLSQHALTLVQTVYQDLDDQQRDQALNQLRQETVAVMNLLLGLDHDDRLFSGTLTVSVEDTYQTWQNQGILERFQEFRGRHLGSDWHYRITWRYLLIDVAHSFPLRQKQALSLL